MVLVETLKEEVLFMPKFVLSTFNYCSKVQVAGNQHKIGKIANLEEHAEHGYLSHVALPPPPLLPRQPHTSGSGKGAHAAMLV